MPGRRRRAGGGVGMSIWAKVKELRAPRCGGGGERGLLRRGGRCARLRAMARVAFTANLRRHREAPLAEAEGATVREVLERVVQVLPCMREPTISPLHGDQGFAIKVAAPRDELPTLITRIKSLGGTDILVTQLSQIVP